MRRVLDFDPTNRSDGPCLRCPISPAIHEDVAAAQVGSVRWALDMGLTTPHSPGLAVLAGGRFARLAARSYAYGTAEQVRLAADWITALFFYDDLCDTLRGAGDEQDEALLVALDARLIATLRGEHEGPVEAYCRAIADIRARVLAHADPGWLRRLADDTALYLQGVRWERAAERNGEITLAAYRHMRPMISAVYACMDLAGSFVAPDDPTLGRDPVVRELERMANNHISWVNDIYSLDRELAYGRTANLVLALAREERVGLARALDHAIDACNRELDAFTRLAGRLSALGVGGAEAYVRVMTTWVRGNFDWHAESDRYNGAQGVCEGITDLAA